MIIGYHGSINDITETELAIISVGSIEQHGPHLPVITDWAIADAMGRAVAEKTGGFYIPALPISTNAENRGKRGSVGMHSDVFYAMLRDICLNLKNQGFKRIAIIQTHGGIFVMNPVVRELNADFNPDLMVAKLDMLEICWPKYNSAGILETSNELHAGEGETSLMLYLHPELVDMSKAVDYVPDIPRGYLNYGTIPRFSPEGVWGEATKGTAEKGKRMFEFSVDETVKEMNKIFDYMQTKKPLNGCAF
ncbi:MAG: creatininase family protein [Oscillospiraceae bacterium]